MSDPTGATVTAVNAGSTVDLWMLGGTVKAVPFNAALTLNVGDVVVVDWVGSQPHVVSAFGADTADVPGQWQTPLYVSGWSDYTDPAWQPLRWHRSASGWVEVAGLCVAASGAAGTTIFQLPAGSRPARKRPFFCSASNGAGDLYNRVDVWPDGSVLTALIGTHYVAAQIYFHAEQ